MSKTRDAQLVVCIMDDELASDAIAAALSTELAVKIRRFDLWVTVPDSIASLRVGEVDLLVTSHCRRTARKMFRCFCPTTDVCYLGDPPDGGQGDHEHFISPQSRLCDLASLVSGLLPTRLELQPDSFRLQDTETTELVVAAISQLKPTTRTLVEELAAGRSIKQAAARIGVSKRTAENMKYAAIEQLNLRTSTDLIRFGLEWIRTREDALRPETTIADLPVLNAAD